MLDPITTGIIIVLGKYALDKGVELGKEVGPKALDTAKEIFVAALGRLRHDPKAEVVADEFEADPETYAKPVEKKLEQVVQADPAFKAQMAALLQKYDAAAAAHAQKTGTQYSAVLKGGGAIAQGQGATAVGAGGVNVGGNVGGSIITGSGNVINTGAASGAALPPSLAPLRDKMISHFSLKELKLLAFSLSVAPDDIPGETRGELAQGLVAFFHNRNRLAQLKRQLKVERPFVEWEDS